MSQFVSNIIASFPNQSVYLLAGVPMLRFLVTLVLGLYLFSDQCYGFAEEGLRELCRKLPKNGTTKKCNCPAKNGPSIGPSESSTFSCGHCLGMTKASYVCKYCYKGTENDAFSCQGCRFGTMSMPVICDNCESKLDHASQESATGCHMHLVIQYGTYSKLQYTSSHTNQNVENVDYQTGLADPV